MKPSKGQLEQLKKYLRENLKYRETYTEFYDHIFSALEKKPDHLLFQDTVNDIVQNDFGGVQGMLIIEDQYSSAIRKEMKKNYWQYIAGYFTVPLIGVTAVIALLFYIIIIQPSFNFFVFLEMLFAIRIVTGLYRWIRHFKIGYVYKDTKRSVKDNIYTWLDYIPAYAFVLLVILFPSAHKDTWNWFKHINPVFVTVILLLTTLHTFTYYRLYKNEFKTKVITVN